MCAAQVLKYLDCQLFEHFLRTHVFALNMIQSSYNLQAGLITDLHPRCRRFAICNPIVGRVFSRLLPCGCNCASQTKKVCSASIQSARQANPPGRGRQFRPRGGRGILETEIMVVQMRFATGYQSASSDSGVPGLALLKADGRASGLSKTASRGSARPFSE